MNNKYSIFIVIPLIIVGVFLACGGCGTGKSSKEPPEGSSLIRIEIGAEMDPLSEYFPEDTWIYLSLENASDFIKRFKEV